MSKIEARKPYFLHLKIPGLPKPVNRLLRKHWAVQLKEANYWKEMVRSHVGRKLPKKPLTRARLEFVRGSSKAPDPDGMVSGFKHIQDGLVMCGVLKNDTLDVIDFPKYEWVKTKPKEGFIEIKVYEVLDSLNKVSTSYKLTD